MRQAGFGAADVVIPTAGSSRTPTIVDFGGVSGFSDPRFGGASADRGVDGGADQADAQDADPTGGHGDERSGSQASSGADAPDQRSHATQDADPTMVMPPDAAPFEYVRTTPPPAKNGAARRKTPVPGPAPASRLRDAIARDRDGGERPRRPTLTDDDLRLTPQPDVAYRNTRSSSDPPHTLTPPPDAVLKRSGVHEDELPSSLERRRGRFGRRISGLVVLPVTLSWLLSAGFIYVLLPDGVRGDLWVPLAAATAIAALTGALAAGLATTRIAGDVVRLRDDAQRIAMGDLASPVRVRRDDELGDTAASVDRLRVSLQEALERLRKRH
ncbi:MAG: HAMP domain-containing protein [Trueperaceae bacterium]|nr:MAG: HAMP domain-containing protein [Trueperaceae bacterium]